MANQEIWKTYPDYPFVEVSNLGMVRTKDRVITGKDGKKYHYRGRTLKRWLNSCGYMYVTLHANGKSVKLSVHRMVAITFIPNPNNYPEVNHKDNNPQNNAVSNLEWCDRQYNNDYKKNFGTTSAELFGRSVIAIDLKNFKIFRFKTQLEAARQLDANVGNINDVLKGKHYTAGGYWFTEDESEITEEKIREIKDKMLSCPVFTVNLETGEVLWFKSQREAGRQLGIDPRRINDILKGRQNKTGIYWFCYADGNTIEKTRKRFGDEVAKKVEKLMNQNQN